MTVRSIIDSILSGVAYVVIAYTIYCVYPLLHCCEDADTRHLLLQQLFLFPSPIPTSPYLYHSLFIPDLLDCSISEWRLILQGSHVVGKGSR